jgi:hypothetical protein
VTPAFYELLIGFLGLMTWTVALRNRLTVSGRAVAWPVRSLSRIADIAAIVIGVGTAGVLLVYLAAPGYFDHAEPLVAATTWMYVRGRTIFPDWAHGQGFYGDNKGPALYLVNSFVLRLVPAIWSSKLTGCFAGLGAIAVQVATYRRLQLSTATALRLAAIAFLVSSVEFYTFSDRADSFTYLLVSISLLLTTFDADARLIAAIMGVLAGFATAMKLDGILYFLPPLVWLLASETRTRPLLQAFCAFAVLAAAGFFLPYLVMGASVPAFLSYIVSTAHQGFSFDWFCGNVLLALSLAFIAVSGYAITGAQADRRAQLFQASLVFALFAGAVGGAKPGAGMHHLYAFAPSAVFAVGQFLRTAADTPAIPNRPVLALTLFAVVVSFGAGTAYVAYQMARETLYIDKHGAERLADLDRLQARYPGAELGVSDMAHYEDALLYPEMVFHGGGLSLVSATWMDLAYGGVSERYAMRVLDDCHVAAWVFPHSGEPFSLTSYYTDASLYSPAFRARFLSNYRLTEQDAYFDVWACRRRI